ncbi:MAG: hypothetical protein KH031_10060 [Clostridiales bacterium]|nr:hypothetical protein [Clostridiales bacterium]
MSEAVILSIVALLCLLLFCITSTIHMIIIKNSRPSHFHIKTGYGSMTLEYKNDQEQSIEEQ